MDKHEEFFEPKPGKIKSSWLVTKSSWDVMMLDKELIVIPILAFLIISIVSFLAMVLAPIELDWFTGTEESNQLIQTLVILTFAIVVSSIWSIFAGALIQGALERFKGNDPTIKGCIFASLKRSGSLVQFSVFSVVLGYIISTVASKIPFIGGAVLQWLASSAWSVASFFAIPAIVSSDIPVGPITATKKSINLIKKVWGESLIVSYGIGIFGLIAVFIYTFFIGAVATALAVFDLSSLYFMSLGIISVFILTIFVLTFSVLSTLAKAALYHYAITGESPVVFNDHVLKQAFSKKVKRTLFRS